MTVTAAVFCGALSYVHASDSVESLTQGEQAHVDKSSGEAIAPADPTALIDAMSLALQTLNYEGTFVYMQGMSLKSMHILHASDYEGELERMTSLDGEAREVIRDHSLVTCIFPGSESVVLSKSKPRDLLPKVTSSLTDSVLYSYSLGDADRVAGRATHVVEVTPRDDFRYGYRFWIDKETHMLLRSKLLDGPDKAVEQVLFTSIEYPEHVDRSRFDIDTDQEHISWIEPKATEASERFEAFVSKRSPSSEAVDRVSFHSLPAGYEEVSETYRTMPINDGPISHVMVSDGMASVSVYVEHVNLADQDENAAGLSSMGAMNAYGMSLDEAFVTVVGEVPASTVMAIAKAVKIEL